MWLRSLILGLCVAAGGCVAGEIGPIDTSSAIELGTGESDFLSLEHDSELQVVLGTQGGYHVVGNARIQGFVPQPVLGEQPDGIRFEVLAYDGIPLNLDSGAIHSSLQPHPDGSFTCLPGHHVMVGARREELDGTPAVFTVEMEGMDGELLTDSRRVILTFVDP